MEKFIQQVITLLFLFLFSFFHELQPAVYDLVDHPEQPYEALGHLPPAAVWIDRREQREEIDEVRLADLLHDPRDNLLEAAARMIRMMIEGDQVRREGGGGDQIERGVEHRAPDVHRPARPPPHVRDQLPDLLPPEALARVKHPRCEGVGPHHGAQVAPLRGRRHPHDGHPVVAEDPVGVGDPASGEIAALLLEGLLRRVRGRDDGGGYPAELEGHDGAVGLGEARQGPVGLVAEFE
ncbi:putative geraniol 8-hydroxylase [Iris pallida]|uniref:Geraniol 8-hydroxylase n=1 Tax=Iris pallida TaxID=29817 RepID=A0AAX6I851_IRIPA|nr:putative geraniol 8-hydroxylase [Iris pallida]